MLIEEKLFECLSPLVEGRVYPQIIPIQNERYPAITFTTISTNSNHTICGESDEDVRVQIDIYSKDAVEVLQLRKIVTNAIRAMFDGASRINDFDNYEREVDLYRRILEFQI